jgi:hypothetical protein
LEIIRKRRISDEINDRDENLKAHYLGFPIKFFLSDEVIKFIFDLEICLAKGSH